MTIEQILTIGIPTFATTIVGVILRSQIKKQNQIIKDYEGYIKAIDWKNVQDHYEKFIVPKEVALAKQKLEEEFVQEINAKLNPKLDNFLDEFSETLIFSTRSLYNAPIADRVFLIQKYLPKTQRYFSKILDESVAHNIDNPTNP